MLGHRIARIVADIGYGDAAARLRGGEVDDVVAGRRDGDQLQLRSAGERRAVDRRLVGDDDIRPGNAVGDFVRRRAIMYRQPVGEGEGLKHGLGGSVARSRKTIESGSSWFVMSVPVAARVSVARRRRQAFQLGQRAS